MENEPKIANRHEISERIEYLAGQIEEALNELPSSPKIEKMQDDIAKLMEKVEELEQLIPPETERQAPTQ